jgi:HSP20 family molecular chaperone IbpA
MWDEAVRVLDQAEGRQRQFYGIGRGQSTRTVWEPPADVFETDAEVLVFIALPGVDSEKITVQVTPAGLVVGAERAPPSAIELTRIRRLEIPYGQFERSVELAPGQYRLLERRMVDGCLLLRLAKE